MHVIESHIRKAVEKLADNSPESRAQIYLAAKDAIEKMPPDKSPDAMQVLFDAVKSIEAEFVSKEFDQPAPPNATAEEPAKKKRRIYKFSIPWGAIMATLALALFISGSSYLLYTQF